MEQELGAQTGKSVVVLKPCDVVERDGTVFMPNTIEMAQLKKAGKGQFKKNVQFSSKMTESDIKGILVEKFPFLNCQRFYCAAAADGRTRLEFHGERRIWDGRFLKRVIKGNSALYIFAEESKLLPAEETSELEGWSVREPSCSFTGEQSSFTGQETLDDIYQARVGFSTEELDSIPRMEIDRQQETAVIAGPRAQGFTEGSDHYNTSSDVNATSSGICSEDGDLVFSDQSISENFFQDQLIRTETKQDFKPEIRPKRVPFYQVAPVFLVKFEHPPPSEVQSLSAKFESLGDVLLRRLNDDTFSGERMPAASRPCIVKVSVESESGRPLGETEVDYFDDPRIYPILFRHLARIYDGSNGHAYCITSNSANGENSNGNTQGDTGSSGNGGFTQQLQSLQHLVNAMVASGALWLIEPIFKSTAGRMLLHSYKETSQLPEVIARKNGHEETAKFLADITKRLSEDTEFFPDDAQKIDWSELVFLVERAQEQEIGGIAVDQENYQAENDLTIDTGYFADVETSSGNLSLQSKSDSDDNSSEISFEDSFEEDETQLKTDAFKKYSDEKPDLPSRDLSDVNFPKEGLAVLVQSYVEASNRPGVIPNIQDAWETFVEKKCSEAITEAVKKYEEVMESNLKEECPCDDDELRKFHGKALEKGEDYFMTETVRFSTNSTEEHRNKLKKRLNKKLKSWKTRNEMLTREFCNNLLSHLKEKHLDPVLQRLQGKEAAKISFDEINDGCNQIKEKYKNSAKGAKDVVAAVFAEFHPALLKEQEQALNWLGRLKDSDEKLAKACQQLENQRLEDTKSSRPLCEIHVAPPTLQVNLRGPFSGFTDGSKDEEAKARAAPNGSASGGVQNTHPTISSGNNPGTASVPSFGWVPLQQMFGGNSSQPPGMGPFQAGSLGRFDGLFSELLDEDYITRGVDNSLRRFKRETRMMSESPFPDLLDPFGKLFK